MLLAWHQEDEFPLRLKPSNTLRYEMRSPCRQASDGDDNARTRREKGCEGDEDEGEEEEREEVIRMKREAPGKELHRR